MKDLTRISLTWTLRLSVLLLANAGVACLPDETVAPSSDTSLQPTDETEDVLGHHPATPGEDSVPTTDGSQPTEPAEPTGPSDPTGPADTDGEDTEPPAPTDPQVPDDQPADPNDQPADPDDQPTDPAPEDPDPAEPPVVPVDPSDDSPGDTPSTNVPARGVGLCPRTHDAAGYLDALDLAEQAGSVGVVQVNLAWDFLRGWTDGRTYRPRYDWLVQPTSDAGENLFEQHALSGAFWISFTQPADTRWISAPDDLGVVQFTDPAVATAYAQECAWFAAYAQPAYLALGVEVDSFLAAASVQERAAYLAALQKTYTAVKAAQPDCVVFVYFQYENVRSKDLWQLIAPFARVGDAYAFSSYPSLPVDGEDTGRTSANLPEDYFQPIVDRLGSDRPIVIAEFGHPAAPSSYFQAASVSEQAAMVQRLFDVLAQLDVTLVAWTYLYDADLSSVYPPAVSDYFGSMGLLRLLDTQPADAAWTAWTSP